MNVLLFLGTLMILGFMALSFDGAEENDGRKLAGGVFGSLAIAFILVIFGMITKG